MLNREKYAADLEKVFVNALAVNKNGEVLSCEHAECEECIFQEKCSNDNTAVKEWLNSEYIEIVDWDKIRAVLMLVTGRKGANALEWKRRISWRIDIYSAGKGLITENGYMDCQVTTEKDRSEKLKHIEMQHFMPLIQLPSVSAQD